MLEALPRDADLYMIKRVLKICGDAEALTVPKNCVAHVQSGGKVLVVEMVMPPVGVSGPAATFDILMLLANEGGRIRTDSEFRDISLRQAKLDRMIPTGSLMSAIPPLSGTGKCPANGPKSDAGAPYPTSAENFITWMQ